VAVIYIGLGDLAERWVYTIRGIRKLTLSKDFPPPAFAINRGRTKVWNAADIEGFELEHPEVIDAEAKRRKIAGYAAAVAKKRKAG